MREPLGMARRCWECCRHREVRLKNTNELYRHPSQIERDRHNIVCRLTRRDVALQLLLAGLVGGQLMRRATYDLERVC